MRYMIPGQAAFEGVWRKPDARDDQIDNLTERIEELERREPRDARIAELEAALRECMKDSFTASNGMSESGKASFAGKRYTQAVAALNPASSEKEMR